MKTKTCTGFGPHKTSCGKPVDKKTSMYWCKECQQARRESIGKSMDKLLKMMDSGEL